MRGYFHDQENPPKCSDELADFLGEHDILQVVAWLQVTSLIRALRTFPATTCSAERTFSVLRRLKTNLRSSMSQQRLANVAVCHVHKEYLENFKGVTVDVGYKHTGYKNISDIRTLYWKMVAIYPYIVYAGYKIMPVIRTFMQFPTMCL